MQLLLRATGTQCLWGPAKEPWRMYNFAVLCHLRTGRLEHSPTQSYIPIIRGLPFTGDWALEKPPRKQGRETKWLCIHDTPVARQPQLMGHGVPQDHARPVDLVVLLRTRPEFCHLHFSPINSQEHYDFRKYQKYHSRPYEK